MRIYKDKETGSMTIIFSAKENCNVTLVKDQGKGDLRNMFGGKVHRYIFHCACATGDSGYSTCTDKFKLGKDDIPYKLKRK